MSTRLTSPNKAFTLVEVLVVLSVISILSALLLGVFVRVRERGRSATCQSNLSQIAMAMHQYLQDNNGRFPSVGYGPNIGSPSVRAFNWNDAVWPYLKTNPVFWCPTSQMRDQTGSNYGFNWTELNSQLHKTGNKINNLAGAHESLIASASDVMLDMDLCAEHGDGSIVDGMLIETSCGSILASSLHSSGGNASYVDGHVKWMSAAQQAEVSCAKQQSGEHHAIDD